MNDLAGISEANRRYLTLLHRHTNGLVDIDKAARLLEMDHTKVSKLLARMASQGWVRRLRRGVYLLIPLEAASPDDWSVDPWIVADHLFKPAYIAGWSACEHWGFTEQIFRDVAVFTAAAIRERSMTVDRTVFVLRKIPEELLFGTHTVWRRETRVEVSDPTRTLVDIMDEPKWGGGIRHLSRVLEAYLVSEHYDRSKLLEYLERVGNYAAAKRLGYLLETLPTNQAPLINDLRPLITEGYALLDPSAPTKGPFVARWNIRVNVETLI
jgi:predicted transcriptional regulator of viral defense system